MNFPVQISTNATQQTLNMSTAVPTLASTQRAAMSVGVWMGTHWTRMTETAQVSKFKPHSQAPPPNTSLGMSPSLFLHFEMEVGMRLSKSQLS